MAIQWVSIPDAATALGVSTQTVRRRIHAGKLPTQREQARGGFTWRVGIEQANGSPVGEHRQPNSQVDTQAFLEALRERDQRIEELAGLVAMYQERSVTLAAQVKLLEAPRPEPIAEKPQPWWQRLFGQR
jgi:hypothetical protein